MLVYPDSAYDTVRPVAVSLAGELSRNGYETFVVSDSAEPTVAPEATRILLGNTQHALSKSATISGEKIRFLTDENTIAVNAGDDTLLYLAVHTLLSDCLIEGELILSEFYQDKTLDVSGVTRAGWQLDFPAYTAGTLDSVLYSCGYGLVEGEDQSDMHLVTDTTATEFTAYKSLLESWGYTKVFENQIDGNLYASYTSALGETYYIYYLQQTEAQTGTVRVIRDRGSNVSLKDFCYTTQGSANSEFYMFNLNTANEDTFLIRTADNSWIFIDGGITNYNGQDTEEKYADALFQFMSERSGRKDGEKLVISCWYLTHAHRDHFLAFESLIKKYHDQIDLQRIIANVPDATIADHNSNMSEFRTCMNTIRTYFPNVAYLKAHTGMKIQLADVEFTVLFTQEDMVDFWVKNREDYKNKWVAWKSLTSSDPNYETYRTGYKLYDYNNSSLISVISVNGLTVLEMGDGYRAETWVVPYYSLNTLTTDILKVAHHFNNDELVEFYKQLSAQKLPHYALVTNAAFSDSTKKQAWYQNLSASYGQYFLEANYTTVYGFQKVNGAIQKNEYKAIYSYGATQQ